MVLPYINMNPPQVYTCSSPRTPFPPPSHTIPLGHLSASAPSIQYHASNLDWWFVSYMILSDFTFTFHFHALEKEMATHSSILAWRTPGAEEPSGLPPMGSHRVGHAWNDSAVDHFSCECWTVNIDKLPKGRRGNRACFQWWWWKIRFPHSPPPTYLGNQV